MAIFFILLSRIFYAGSNILDSYIANNIFKKLSTVVFYNGITNILAIPLVLIFGLPKALPLNYNILIFLCLVCIIEVLYQFPYYQALKKVDTSIVTAMFSLGKIVIPIMAYYMVDERLSITQYCGFFIVIFFNLMLNIDLSKKQKFNINNAFFMMLSISLLLSFQGVAIKKILLNIDWITYIFWSSILSSIFSFSIYLIPNNRNDINNSFVTFKQKYKILLSMEALNQIASLLTTVALTMLPIVVVKSISSTQPIFVLFIGVILHKIYGDKFKENTNKKDICKKVICFVFIIIGVILSI